MSYDEDEVVLNDMGFNPKEEDTLDDDPFEEPLEENDDFRFDENEEPEAL
jgi:hypothetical protein